MTLAKTRTEPMDRSIPAVTITKVTPTPKMMKMEALTMIDRKLKTLKKASGLMMVKSTIMPRRTRTIWVA